MSDFEEHNMGAYIEALKTERDEYKRQAWLYHSDMMKVREQRDRNAGAHCECVKRAEQLEDEIAVLLEWKAKALCNPSCVHCGAAIPIEEREHWRACDKHPAHKEIERLHGVIAKYRPIVMAARVWSVTDYGEPELTEAETELLDAVRALGEDRNEKA